MSNSQFLSIFLLFTFVSITRGEKSSTQLLTSERAIELALTHHRELAIAALEVDRARIRAQWAGRLDNPELELSASDDGVGLDEGERTLEVAFAQRFPLTSRLRDERSLRGSQILLAEAEIAERRREVAAAADAAVVDYRLARERIALHVKLVQLNETIVGFLSRRAELGEISALEVNQARLTGRSLEQRVATLESAQISAALEVRQALGLEPDADFEITGELNLPSARPEAVVANLKARPDYVLALAKIDEAAAALALQQARRWEDISLRVFVESERAVDAPEGLEDNTFAGVGLSIPLPIRQRNQAGIAIAEIDQIEAKRAVEAVAFTIRSEVERASRQRLAAYDLAKDASGEFLELAKKNLGEFRTAYQQGQASLLQVQRAQEQLLELDGAALEAIAAYHIADAELRKALGDYPSFDSNASQITK